MARCVASLLALSSLASGPAPNLWIGFAGLGGFGAGLGIFIAPNDDATIEAVPAKNAGKAGSILNLMRILGTSLGIASSASILSWRMQVLSGTNNHKLTRFPAHQVVEAVAGGLLMLAVFAAAAGFLVLIGGRRAPAAA